MDIALRIFKCTAVTNCTAERSFSSLSMIKNYLRSNMSENRLNDLSILSIENYVLNNISFDKIIHRFSETKVRRKIIKS